MAVVPLALRRDPLEVLAGLAAEPGAFLLDVPDPVRPVTLLGCAPRARFDVFADGTVAEGGERRAVRDPLAALARFVAAAPCDPDLPFPVGGGAIGVLGYELGRATEPAGAFHPVDPARPVAVVAHYDPLVVYDAARAQYLLVSVGPEAGRAPWLERLAAPAPAWAGPLAAAPLAPAWPAEAYRAAVRRVLAHLAAGDVYQVNLTLPFTAALAAPAWALHARLARHHPVPYGAYLDIGHATVVANSPELFLRRRGDEVETRPIKGTRPRARGAADDALAADLRRDPKERAEHVMIVDLERNDLGRVAATGSVVVREYARLESHPTVHHLVSTVAARLRPGVGLAELLRATFPGGSITGAPKVRATEIIRALEPGPRGPYTGAFGLLHPAGDLELALAIRTAVVEGGVLRWDAGGGIVADSDPERELAEAWLKTAALRLALDDEPDRASECSSG